MMKKPLCYILALITVVFLCFTSPVLGFEFPDTSQWGSSTGAGLFSGYAPGNSFNAYPFSSYTPGNSFNAYPFSSYTPGNSFNAYPFSSYTRGTLISPFG
jgi:hypothetical protein